MKQPSEQVLYRIKLLKSLYVVDGEPGEIAYHPGEVIIVDAHEAISLLKRNVGEVVGDIADGVMTKESDWQRL